MRLLAILLVGCQETLAPIDSDSASFDCAAFAEGLVLDVAAACPTARYAHEACVLGVEASCEEVQADPVSCHPQEVDCATFASDLGCNDLLAMVCLDP